MDSFEQSGTWNSGRDFYFNPDSQSLSCHQNSPSSKRLLGDSYQEFWHRNDHSNPTTFEPNFQCSSWNSPSCNQWENRMNSFQEPKLEPSPSFNITGGEQEEEARSYTERLLAMMDVLLQTYQNFKADTQTVLEQHKEKISELEQAKSGSEEVITVQAKKIEMLEETVSKLGTRLQVYQKQQTNDNNANLRRIKQAHIEFQNLRGRVEYLENRPVHSEEVHHCQPYEDDDSSDGETVEVIYTEPCPCCHPQLASSTTKEKAVSKPSTEEKSVSRDEHPRFQILQTEEYPSTSSKDLIERAESDEAMKAFIAEFLRDLEDEEPYMATENAQKQEGSTSPPTLIENSQQDCQIVRIGKITVIESITGRLREELKAETSTSVPEIGISVTPPNSTSGTSTSCSSCGLNCENQLRACVNAIKVQPSLIKVEENEVRKMRSKHKRKLQRAWVPRGTFVIKELCRIDTILSELKCIHQVLPRVRKRQKKPPDFHDSGD